MLPLISSFKWCVTIFGATNICPHKNLRDDNEYPPLPLYCGAFHLLLPQFSVAAASFLMSSPSPPPSTSSCYLHKFFLVVCCWSLSLFIVVLSPFSSSRSLPAPAPHSSAPATVFLPSLLLFSRLFDCCVHPRQI